MKIIKHLPDGLKILEPTVFKDNRGYFYELNQVKKIKKLLKKRGEFVQDNVSFSKKNVFRGFHFQKKPYQQGKLVTVLKGEIIDYAININKKSKNYLKSYEVRLNDKNSYLFWIPKDFAHGFFVKSKYALVHYKVDNYFKKSHDSGVNLKSKKIDIKLPKNLIISDKDKKLSVEV